MHVTVKTLISMVYTGVGSQRGGEGERGVHSTYWSNNYNVVL